MSYENDERRRKLREDFIEVRGYWNPFWDSLLGLDPDFFAAYLEFSAVPWRNGPLEPKVKELIYITVDAAATHLFVPASASTSTRRSRWARRAEEIMEVLELTSTLGIHAANIGVPILVEELEAAGAPIDRELSERQREIKADFEANRGYWNPFWDDMLALDPDFFAAYTQFSSVPWKTGVLEPKIKELIYTAFDVAATHLYVPGLRQHIRNALGFGATREEIMEVIEIASVIGIHSCAVGVPILLEELGSAQ